MKQNKFDFGQLLYSTIKNNHGLPRIEYDAKQKLIIMQVKTAVALGLYQRRKECMHECEAHSGLLPKKTVTVFILHVSVCSLFYL